MKYLTKITQYVGIILLVSASGAKILKSNLIIVSRSAQFPALDFGTVLIMFFMLYCD